MNALRVPSVDTTYLGYPLTITDTTVTVRGRDGRQLGTVRSVKEARLFVRGYRRAERTAA